MGPECLIDASLVHFFLPASYNNYPGRLRCNALYAEFSYILQITFEYMTTTDRLEHPKRTLKDIAKVEAGGQ